MLLCSSITKVDHILEDRSFRVGLFSRFSVQIIMVFLFIKVPKCTLLSVKNAGSIFDW